MCIVHNTVVVLGVELLDLSDSGLCGLHQTMQRGGRIITLCAGSAGQ